MSREHTPFRLIKNDKGKVGGLELSFKIGESVLFGNLDTQEYIRLTPIDKTPNIANIQISERLGENEEEDELTRQFLEPDRAYLIEGTKVQVSWRLGPTTKKLICFQIKAPLNVDILRAELFEPPKARE